MHTATETPYPVSEEDGHVQTLHRMTNETNETPLFLPHSRLDDLRSQQVIEYYDRFNSVSILGQAIGRRQQRRLIHLELPETVLARQRELTGLDQAEIDYLEARRVFELPPKPGWYDIVSPQHVPELIRGLVRVFFNSGLSTSTHIHQSWTAQGSTKTMSAVTVHTSSSMPCWRI